MHLYDAGHVCLDNLRFHRSGSLSMSMGRMFGKSYYYDRLWFLGQLQEIRYSHILV